MRIHKGSIFDVDADVIVNPANSFLWNGAGLAGMIDKAARGGVIPGFTDNERRAARIAKRGGYTPATRAWVRETKNAPLIATGNAHLTSAGALPFRACVHTVGPIWNGGGYDEKTLLRMAYGSALSRAEEAGYGSIVFPAVSCGIFGFPVEQAAPLAVETCYLTSLDVTFALMEDAHVDAFAESMATIAQRRADAARRDF